MAPLLLKVSTEKLECDLDHNIDIDHDLWFPGAPFYGVHDSAIKAWHKKPHPIGSLFQPKSSTQELRHKSHNYLILFYFLPQVLS
jgi:hypothetical protein